MVKVAMPARTVALIGAVCLTIGWLLASTLTPPVARLQALPDRRAAQAPTDTPPVAAFSEELQLRLRQASDPPTPRRNPFAFGTRERAATNSSQPRTVATEVAAPGPPPVVGPLFSLSGIGVTQTPKGSVHTAVLSDGTMVHLLKAGDSIGGYSVIDVTDDTVILSDAGGARYILSLR